jgi:hypothetical protein
MRARFAILLAFAVLALPAGAEAATAPAWSLSVSPMPANFLPGGEGEIFVLAPNVGGAHTTGTTTIEVDLPPELTPGTLKPGCSVAAQTVSCQSSETVKAGGEIKAQIPVSVEAGAAGTVAIAARIAGGGGGEVGSGTAVALHEQPVPFGVLPPGLRSPLSEVDGAASTAAGSHPFQLTTTFTLPARGGEDMTNDGHPREFRLHLPPGLIGDPAALPVLCKEAELQALKCPPDSQVGRFAVTTLAFPGVPGVFGTPLYAMVPPPGHPAELATDVAHLGIFAHLLASVRSDGDYGIDISTPDAVALGSTPVFAVTVQTWGDPSADDHDEIRGSCGETASGSCLIAPQPEAFLTQPTSCPGEPTVTGLEVDTWESPGAFVSSEYRSADLGGNEVSTSDCNALSFAPGLSARPTTNLADSPSGLDVDLHQPTDLGKEHRSPAQLRDATVTLPEGMAVNPSQADGLGACSTAQIGLSTPIGATPIHLDKTPNSCPDASKLGTVEVTTPLLVEYEDEGTKPVHDPETGKVIPRPLHGSVYLAKPFENPFDSLLAIYLTVEDPQSGTVAKLAGRIEADPQTGQLTTTFSDNPQLPLEDVKLHLFDGARGSLITPPTCGTHTTTTDLVPWSSPEGADAHPSSSFQTTTAPGGGVCPNSADKVPNTPSFTAGTLNPQAGAYTPFVLKLGREDGTQRLTGFDSKLPPGLTGKLAGIATCSDAALAQAGARSHPNEGILERNNPSCPSAAALGTVTIGAGAGPTPFYTQGTAYLAGPYKGAPLSMAVVTPAIAGPFDLGVVVVRAALYVDPESARIHAVSDPFPTILQGIPLDLRSVAVKLDRPSFTLNPTSCNPMQITGSAVAANGAAASLVSPFQVGGCSSLAFKPKLAIKLSGGTRRSKNPALRAILTMPPAGANVARASVALPHSEFLDQAHIRTICTRVQFAEGPGNGAGCPPGSVYGKARAITPLLDTPLEGPVFMRANGGERELPDLVAALHGQIEVELIGFIDSAKGGIRTTFEGVPDAPVSKFVLEMQGGKKGLLQNSINLCHETNRATALFDGQNGKVGDFNPLVKNDCRGKKGGGRKGRGKGGKQ